MYCEISLLALVAICGMCADASVPVSLCWTAPDGQPACGEHEDWRDVLVRGPHASRSILWLANHDYAHFFLDN